MWSLSSQRDPIDPSEEERTSSRRVGDLRVVGPLGSRQESREAGDRFVVWSFGGKRVEAGKGAMWPPQGEVEAGLKLMSAAEERGAAGRGKRTTKRAWMVAAGAGQMGVGG